MEKSGEVNSLVTNTSDTAQPKVDSSSQQDDSAAFQPTSSANLMQQPMSSDIPKTPEATSATKPAEEKEDIKLWMKIIGWYFFVLGPLSLVTAILSFLRSGDTFIEPLPYLLYGVLNLALFIFYLKLSGMLRKKGGKKSKILGLVMFPVSLVLLGFSWFYLYSLVFSFPR